MIIPLTRGLCMEVDPEDYYVLSQWNWWALASRGCFYAARHDGVKDRKNVVVLAHRQIMPAPDGLEIDHISGNKLDNRKENLRFANHRENSRNTLISKRTSTGFKGVASKPRKDGTLFYWAYIKVGDRQTYLGAFNDKIDAAKAYDREAKRVFGEYAMTNFKEQTGCSQRAR